MNLRIKQVYLMKILLKIIREIIKNNNKINLFNSKILIRNLFNNKISKIIKIK